VVALSEQLVRVHQELRERLASLRAEIDSGTTSSISNSRTTGTIGIIGTTGTTGNSGPDDLLSHCLGFCTAIHTHHTGEDRQLFPALRAAAPELVPIISKLEEDHVLVAGILRQIRDLLTARPAAPDPDPDSARLQRELDGLTAILESHFSFEERRIANALDALGPQSQFPVVFTSGSQFPP
jgi:hypothetical protein